MEAEVEAEEATEEEVDFLGVGVFPNQHNIHNNSTPNSNNSNHHGVVSVADEVEEEEVAEEVAEEVETKSDSRGGPHLQGNSAPHQVCNQLLCQVNHPHQTHQNTKNTENMQPTNATNATNATKAIQTKNNTNTTNATNPTNATSTIQAVHSPTPHPITQQDPAGTTIFPGRLNWRALENTIVRNWARDGYTLPTKATIQPPAKPRELKSQDPLVLEEVTKYVSRGVLVPLQPGEKAITLTTFNVPKQGGGARITVDWRPVNEACHTPETFTMHTPESVCKKLEEMKGQGTPYMWGTKIDAKDAFNHIKLNPVQGKYVCSLINGVLYKWQGLGFGHTHVPRMWTKIMEEMLKPVRAQMSTRALIVNYIDDILVLGVTQKDVEWTTKTLLQRMKEVNIQVNLEKSNITPHQQVTFLGWTWNLQKQEVYVPQEKMTKVIDNIKKELRRTQLKWRNIAAILGQINAMSMVLRQTAWMLTETRLLMRSRMKGKQVWDEKTSLPLKVRVEWKQWCKTAMQQQQESTTSNSPTNTSGIQRCKRHRVGA